MYLTKLKENEACYFCGEFGDYKGQDVVDTEKVGKDSKKIFICFKCIGILVDLDYNIDTW